MGRRSKTAPSLLDKHQSPTDCYCPPSLELSTAIHLPMYHPDPHSSRDDWYYQRSCPHVHICHSDPNFRTVPPATQRMPDDWVDQSSWLDVGSHARFRTVPSLTQHRSDFPTTYHFDARSGHFHPHVYDVPQPSGTWGWSARSDHTDSLSSQAATSTLGTEVFDEQWISQRLNRLSDAPKIVQPTPVRPEPVRQFLNGSYGAHTEPARHRSRQHRSASTHGDRNALGWSRTYESYETRKERPSTPRHGRPVPIPVEHPASPRRGRSHDTWPSDTALYDIPSVHSRPPKKSAYRHQDSGRRSDNWAYMSGVKAMDEFWGVIRGKLVQRDFEAECVMNWDNRSLTLTLPLTGQMSIRITKTLSEHDLKDPLTVMMGQPAAEFTPDADEIQPLPNILKSRGTGEERFAATSTITPSSETPSGWGLQPKIKWPIRTAEEYEAEGYTTEGLISTLLENGGMALAMRHDVDLPLLLSQPGTVVWFTEKLEMELDEAKSRYPARTFEKPGRRRRRDV